MKKTSTLLLLLMVTVSVFSQFSMRKTAVTPKVADSLDIAYYSKKRGWQAATTVVGLNIGVWAFDRYVQKAEFAYISMKTIRNNFENGFVWDNDQIGTNMFLHPYHGNLYFNAARSNGYNFWEAGGFAFGGSFMWEMVCENEFPSINDVIATPMGGTVLGEVLYRTSDMVLDDRKTGKDRFGRELAAFIIAPTRGLTRIITGDAWKRRSTSGHQFGIPNVSVEISTGVRILELKDNVFNKGAGIATDISVEYGDRYDADVNKPFDYFSFRVNLNIQKSQPTLGQINVIGRLWGSDLVDNSKDYLNIGVYQHFDYYDSDTISPVSNKIPYKFGTPAAVGIGMMHKSKRFSDWSFNSYAHLNAIILGASLSDHYLVDMRNYNIGSGFGWKIGGHIAYKDILGISAWYEGYKLYTWKGYPDGYDLSTAQKNELDAQGDKSNALMNISSIRVDVKLRTQLYLTVIGSLYNRTTNYDYEAFCNMHSTTGEGRLMLTYKF